MINKKTKEELAWTINSRALPESYTAIDYFILDGEIFFFSELRDIIIRDGQIHIYMRDKTHFVYNYYSRVWEKKEWKERV